MVQDQQTYRRAAGAALTGLGAQALLCVGMAVLGLWASDAGLPATARVVNAAALHLLGGLPIWLVLWTVYNQHRLERLEALESEELGRREQVLSPEAREHADDLLLARRRLTTFYKWTLPLVSLGLALYLLGIGAWLLLRNLGLIHQAPAANLAASATPVAAAAAVFAFVGFVVARYLSGMTAVPEWQLLRGGASFLMGNAVVALLILVGAILALFNVPGMAALGLVVPAVVGLIGLEMLVNLLLGAYRPRRPGEIPRPAFDSRLLGWLTSPESLARIISETINYQFGIEVSKSWFYQLLSRAITPLIIFGILMLLLVSSIAVIDPNEKAIKLHMGRRVGGVLEPGIHFKWPWPLETVERRQVGKVLEITVGSVEPETDPEKAAEMAKRGILWTNEHGRERTFLVTAPEPRPVGSNAAPPATLPAAGSAEVPATMPAAANQARSCALVGAKVAVQYRVKDLEQYLQSADDPEAFFTRLIDRQVNAHIVGTDIDTLLTSGRATLGRSLQVDIARDAEAAHLGVEVLFVGLAGVHPPSNQDVAKAFLDQIGARQEAQSKIEQARQKATETLAATAGSRELAEGIDQAIDQLLASKQRISGAPAGTNPAAGSNQGSNPGANPGAGTQAQRQAVAQQEQEVFRRISQAQGAISQMINSAQATRYQYIAAERGDVERFKADIQAYLLAPHYFLERRRLEGLVETLKDRRRIYLVDRPNSPPITWHYDLKDTIQAGEPIEPPKSP